MEQYSLGDLELDFFCMATEWLNMYIPLISVIRHLIAQLVFNLYIL